LFSLPFAGIFPAFSFANSAFLQIALNNSLSALLLQLPLSAPNKSSNFGVFSCFSFADVLK